MQLKWAMFVQTYYRAASYSRQIATAAAHADGPRHQNYCPDCCLDLKLVLAIADVRFAANCSIVRDYGDKYRPVAA
jgi:hypothetical protein